MCIVSVLRHRKERGFFFTHSCRKSLLSLRRRLRIESLYSLWIYLFVILSIWSEKEEYELLCVCVLFCVNTDTEKLHSCRNLRDRKLTTNVHRNHSEGRGNVISAVFTRAGGLAYDQSRGLLQVSNGSRCREACSRTRFDILQKLPCPMVERFQCLAEYWICLCICNVTWVMWATTISLFVVGIVWFLCDVRWLYIYPETFELDGGFLIVFGAWWRLRSTDWWSWSVLPVSRVH